MIQKVDYFKADDGEVFPSEQEAKDHVERARLR